MVANPPQSKHEEPIIRDLENAAITPHDRSSTPETRDIDAPPPPHSPSSAERNAVEPQDMSLWARAQRKLPAPVARRMRTVIAWIRGPVPPRKYRINALLPKIQSAPSRLLSRLPKLAQTVLFLCAFALWVAVFVTIIKNDSLPGDIAGYGAPTRLACISRLWSDATDCGLDGQSCLPFSNHTFAFSCPADCSRVEVLNPYTVGEEDVIYQSLVIGGSNETAPIYRGDSFICAAAIHAGALKDEGGGCGVVSLSGAQNDFGASDRHGISSVGFPSKFPLSFNFLQSDDISSGASKCHDPRWNLLTLSTIFTSLFSIFTSSPHTFFVPIFIIMYFQIALASDAPSFDTYAGAVQTALGNFLPAAFVMALMYLFVIRKTLSHLQSANIEKTILWLGPCWVGALTSITMDKIPIQRLTAHDLSQQPGAITALVFIVLIILGIALYQAWCFRAEGRLQRYLALYGTLGILLLIMLAIPGLDLRIHHYILALLLLPGTSLQTRPSLVYQGLLVGLFIDGIARWGFASVLQTSASLQGDALLESAIPTILAPVINGTTITFTWAALAGGWEGMSVLVNDVERFQGIEDGGSGDSNFTWIRQALDQPEYFRFGFVKYYPFGGIAYSDFTRAGTWQVNGTWTDIPDGSTSG